ncbi:hypothetical protein Dimus_007064 [Dionaea muscipula]
MDDNLVMKIERLRSLQVDNLSNCQSLGGNHRPCSHSWNQLGSQSRKMSLGIFEDSLPKPIYGPAEEDQVVLPSRQKETPVRVNHLERNNGKQEVQAFSKGNGCEAEVGESPNITKKTSNVANLGTYEQSTKCSVQTVANQAISVFENRKQKKVDGIICRKEEENGTCVRKCHIVPYAPAQKVCFAEKGVLQDRTNLPENRNKQMLIMNLWETLGTTASPNKQLPNHQKNEADANDMKREQNKFDTPLKPRQSSDTIEPDSGSPVQPITRAMTRSLTKKRSSQKLHPQATAKKQATHVVVDSKKLRHNQSSGGKVRQQPKVFPFDEKWFGINHNAATTSSISKRTSFKKSGGIKKTGSLLPAKDMGKVRQQPKVFPFDEKWFGINHNAATTSSISKRASFKKSGGIKKTGSLPPAKDMGNPLLPEQISRRPTPAETKKDAPVTGEQTKDSHSSSKLKDKLGDVGGPTSPENAVEQNQFSGQSPLSNDLQCDNLRSPVLEVEPAAPNPFPGSLPQLNVTKKQYCGPAGGKQDCFVRDTFPMGSKVSGSPNTSVMGMKRKNSHSSSKIKCQPGEMGSPTSADNAEKKSHSHGHSLQNVAAPDFSIPEVQMKAAAPSHSHSPLPHMNEIEQQCNEGTHVEAEFFASKFMNRLTRSLDTSGSDTAEPSDATAEIKDSSIGTPVQSMGEKNEEGGQFTSRRPDSIEDNTFGNKGFIEDLAEDSDTFPDIHLIDKPIHHRNKRLRICQDDIYSEFSPILFSLKETDDGMEASQQTEEDELSRAVTLFGLALEKVKCEIMSAMKKRCLDILASSGEEIHQHLQIVESGIQNDIRKLTTQSKSKRKSLETRFQELQGQLKVIHEKFKEEIDRHLLDCRSSVEELEAEQVELGRAIERQKKSHRKLLLQVEEAVQNHITDVQKKITLVHESGREKMLQLKLAIAECLKDGIFT